MIRQSLCVFVLNTGAAAAFALYHRRTLLPALRAHSAGTVVLLALAVLVQQLFSGGISSLLVSNLCPLAGLRMPLLTACASGAKPQPCRAAVHRACAGGLVLGLLLVALASLFAPWLPPQFVVLQPVHSAEQIPLAALTVAVADGLVLRGMLMPGLFLVSGWVLTVAKRRIPCLPDLSGVRRALPLLASALVGCVKFGLPEPGHAVDMLTAGVRPTLPLCLFLLLAVLPHATALGMVAWRDGLEYSMLCHCVCSALFLVVRHLASALAGLPSVPAPVAFVGKLPEAALAAQQ